MTALKSTTISHEGKKGQKLKFRNLEYILYLKELMSVLIYSTFCILNFKRKITLVNLGS